MQATKRFQPAMLLGVTSAPPERIELGALTLRRSTGADAATIATTIAANLDHLAAWMPWATPATAGLEAQQERLKQTVRAWEAGSDFEFIVVPRGQADGPVLGVFGLHRRVGPRAIEMGYWLAHDITGRGYATAAARALTQAALGLEDVDRVEIHCDEANVRSRRVPERVGYRLDRIEDDEVTAPGEVGRSMIWVCPP